MVLWTGSLRIVRFPRWFYLELFMKENPSVVGFYIFTRVKCECVKVLNETSFSKTIMPRRMFGPESI